MVSLVPAAVGHDHPDKSIHSVRVVPGLALLVQAVSKEARAKAILRKRRQADRTSRRVGGRCPLRPLGHLLETRL